MIARDEHDGEFIQQIWILASRLSSPAVNHKAIFTETPGPRLNIKTVFPGYGDSHVKDKTVARPSYL